MPAIVQKAFAGAGPAKAVAQPPFVISSSAMQAYMRCPKSYDFGYNQRLEPATVKDYVTDGADFHHFAAAYAKERRGDLAAEPYPDNDAMFEVFKAWVESRGAAEFDDMRTVLHVEEPVYTHVEDNIWLRTTYDLVYIDKDGWIVCRDYKTFEKAPSLDADLDFQAKSYIATLMQKYQTDKVRFEHVYIRRYPPNVPKQTRAGDSWTPDECYFYEPIVIPKAEAKILWGEVCVAAIMIERKSTVSVTPPGMWYRVPLKGASPYTCGSCFYKGVCKAELNGPLDPDTIQALGYKQRTPPPVDLTAFTKNSKDFFA